MVSVRVIRVVLVVVMGIRMNELFMIVVMMY